MKHLWLPFAVAFFLGGIEWPSRAAAQEAVWKSYMDSAERCISQGDYAGADRFLKLADTCRDIGLNAVEFVGGADNAAFLDDGAENVEGLKVDSSHNENDTSE